MKHSTPEFAEIAENGTILLTQVGSGVHGTAIAGQDDRDEMGICIEPPHHVIGLGRFEQYIYRTQSEGHRSGPGDLDFLVYSLRKWMRLALKGNPTVILPLFVPESEVVRVSALGRELRAHPELIVSREAGHRFIGYMRAQRDRLVGVTGGQHTNRPELIDEYGFDTKYAMHMVRLGVQGVELLETGHITLPVPEPWLTWLRDLRKGRHTKDEALEAARELTERLEKLASGSPLPERPDWARANDWMVRAYQESWNGTEVQLV